MESIDKMYLRPGGSVSFVVVLRLFLKSGLYLAAILLVPGALIGAPILWWLARRRKAAATGVDSMLLTQRCQQP